ncbi:MAG: FKBP-type peptidyl-prolyl cis-trans isomerase [Bacteroidota bacterium]
MHLVVKIIYTVLVASFLLACNDDAQQEQKTSTSPAISEDELIVRLSPDMVASPQNQAERDRNEMLNFAIDSTWNVVATSSGLYYEIVESGTGEPLAWADRLEVHYEGFFMNGKKFDSSYDRNRTLQFYIGNMIDGWNEVLQLVRPRGKINLLVPSRLAYGEKGLVTATGDTLVPPNQALAFKISVLKKIK